jgi:hypothetical protein
VGNLVAHNPNPEGAGVSAPVAQAQVEELVTAVGFSTLNVALEILLKVARSNNVYVNIDPDDVLYAEVDEDYEAKRMNLRTRVAYLVLKNGITIEAREYFNQLRVESIHECQCGDCVCSG